MRGPDSASIEQTVLHMKLVGANPAPRVVGLEKLPGKANYFIGNDSTKWRTNIPTYAKVKYENVYPGMDLVYYGNQRQLEYDFVVAPGTDPKIITLGFEGADKLEVDAQGDLVLYADGGEIRLHKPLVYQDIDGVRQAIAGSYVLFPQTPDPRLQTLDARPQQVGFQVAAYDFNRPLIIDPVLSYSTYLGGSGGDSGSDIAVDFSGNAYVTGSTSSLNFPLMNPLQTTNRGSNDVFVAKLNPTGTALLYSTYLGGSSHDFGNSIAVDASNSAYVTGSTASNNFPTASPLQPAFAGGALVVGDAFVAKLNATGDVLVYSTYLGGSGADGGNSIVVDASSNAYLVTANLFECLSVPYRLGLAAPLGK